MSTIEEENIVAPSGAIILPSAITAAQSRNYIPNPTNPVQAISKSVSCIYGGASKYIPLPWL